MLASQSVLAAVFWTVPIKAGPALSWNIGHGLATTTSRRSCCTNSSRTSRVSTRVGIYYQRGDASELAWGLRKRMNPADEPGEYGAIAAAGTSVYVTYLASDHAANNYDPFAPRQVGVRVNTDHGSSTTWLANKTINETGRAGLPTAAAAGAYGYGVAFTDADSGDIVVASNNGTNAEADSWVSATAGTTARMNGRGWLRRQPGDRRNWVTRSGRLDRGRRRHAQDEDLDRSRCHVARHRIDALGVRYERAVCPPPAVIDWAVHSRTRERLCGVGPRDTVISRDLRLERAAVGRDPDSRTSDPVAAIAGLTFSHPLPFHPKGRHRDIQLSASVFVPLFDATTMSPLSASVNARTYHQAGGRGGGGETGATQLAFESPCWKPGLEPRGPC